MSKDGAWIRLPTIEKVALEGFDLYTRKPSQEIVVEKPVFCLIGANGLGKSTFLNTVSYVVTGAVPDPTRRFQSASDYLKNAVRADRTDDYYRGRISATSLNRAEATVTLAFGMREVAVTRELSGALGVSRLSIDGEEIQREDGSDLDGAYKELVLRETGLKDFAQFVFLSHFVQTFDEGRHLLMWDDAALTNALYLAFGADPSQARDADNLQREVDREDSRARNVRFAARNVTKRIEQLVDVLEPDPSTDFRKDEELRAEQESLKARLDVAADRSRRHRIELREADELWTETSSSLTELQLEYRKVFARRIQGPATVQHHPVLRGTLSENRCGLCGTDAVAPAIEAKLDDGKCPLCDSVLSSVTEPSGEMDELRALDARIGELTQALERALDNRQTAADRLENAEAQEEAERAALREFEEKEAGGLTRLQGRIDHSPVKAELEKLKAERQELLDQSKKHYEKRDELRNRLRQFEKKLNSQYESAAVEFVPRFRELAEEFIGMPVNVQLDPREGRSAAGFGLRLLMNGQSRLQSNDVSESQRFFIDIALRMALAEYMTDGPASLMIDTPEGSLDIAYEARAGAMFSRFANAGNRVVMTANLRSSELVLRLAQQQTEAGMQIVRMTEWTDLSLVQQAEEGLFDEAYRKIEAALL